MVIVDVWVSIVAKLSIFNDSVHSIYIHRCTVKSHKEILCGLGVLFRIISSSKYKKVDIK